MQVLLEGYLDRLAFVKLQLLSFHKTLCKPLDPKQKISRKKLLLGFDTDSSRNVCSKGSYGNALEGCKQ
jgi:hypothetical protein